MGSFRRAIEHDTQTWQLAEMRELFPLRTPIYGEPPTMPVHCVSAFITVLSGMADLFLLVGALQARLVTKSPTNTYVLLLI